MIPACPARIQEPRETGADASEGQLGTHETAVTIDHRQPTRHTLLRDLEAAR